MSSPHEPADDVCRLLAVAVSLELERLEARLHCILTLPGVDLDALRALETRIHATRLRLRTLMGNDSGTD